MTTEQKVTVLVAGLQERYESMRAIRQRVESVGIWALGILLGAGGWLIQSDISLSSLEKSVALGALVAALAAVRFVYLADLQTGFKNQQIAAAKIESALGFYESKALTEDSSDPIYPAKWRAAGTKKGSGRFFFATYLLLYIGSGFLALTIFLSA